VLDEVVSQMKVVRKWRDGVFWEWEGVKNVEQWCFSIGKTEERLLVIGVSATGKGENKTSAGVSATEKVAANGVAAKERGKTKQVLDGVVSGMRMMGE
jgi:hypothetical protein